MMRKGMEFALLRSSGYRHVPAVPTMMLASFKTRHSDPIFLSPLQIPENFRKS